MGGLSQSGAPWMIIAIAMVLKIVIFSIIIFVVYKRIKRHRLGSISAIKILDERYAKGEINEEEYFKRKEVLKKN